MKIVKIIKHKVKYIIPQLFTTQIISFFNEIWKFIVKCCVWKLNFTISYFMAHLKWKVKGIGVWYLLTTVAMLGKIFRSIIWGSFIITKTVHLTMPDLSLSTWSKYYSTKGRVNTTCFITCKKSFLRKGDFL